MYCIILFYSISFSSLFFSFLFFSHIGMESRLGAYSAKGYFLQCCLCHLALGKSGRGGGGGSMCESQTVCSCVGERVCVRARERRRRSGIMLILSLGGAIVWAIAGARRAVPDAASRRGPGLNLPGAR